MRTESVVWRVSSAVALVALIAGCASPPSTEVASTGPAIQATYESVQEGGEAGGAPQVQVIAQGEQFRMSLSDPATPDEVYQTVVWDGESMLLLEGQDASREQDPPADQRPTSFVLQVGDASFERLCPGGERGGSARVAGRAGTVYSCPAHGTGDAAVEASTITLDDETGLLLRSVAGVLTPGGAAGRGGRGRRRGHLLHADPGRDARPRGRHRRLGDNRCR